MSSDFSSLQGSKGEKGFSQLMHCRVSFFILFYLFTFLFSVFSQVLSQGDEFSSKVGVVGQRVTYSNGIIKTAEEKTVPSPPLVRPAFHDSLKTQKHPKGQLASMRTECYIGYTF